MRVVSAGLSQVCVCAIVISLMLTGISYAKIDPKVIVGMWLFDEGKVDTVEDASGNGNEGIVKGNPKWAEGKFGGAVQLDGTSAYIDCGNQEILNMGTDNFSIVAWVKCDKSAPPGWYAMILCKMDHTVPYTGYRINVRGVEGGANKEKPHFILGSQANAGANLFGTKSITDDEWHHLAMTADRKGDAIIYLDGNFEAQMDISDFSDKSEDNTESLCIGARPGGSGLFNGLMDEVAVFKQILTENEIKNIMNTGLKEIVAAASPSGKLATSWGDIKAQ